MVSEEVTLTARPRGEEGAWGIKTRGRQQLVQRPCGRGPRGVPGKRLVWPKGRAGGSGGGAPQDLLPERLSSSSCLAGRVSPAPCSFAFCRAAPDFSNQLGRLAPESRLGSGAGFLSGSCGVWIRDPAWGRQVTGHSPVSGSPEPGGTDSNQGNREEGTAAAGGVTEKVGSWRKWGGGPLVPDALGSPRCP